MNSRRMNRLEELGRVDAEKAFTKRGAKNLKDEKKRIVRELKADGGEVQRKQKAQPKTPRDQQRQRRMGNRSKPKGIGVLEVIEVRKADGGRISGNKSQKKKFRPTKSVKPKAAGSKGKYYREFADGGSLKPVKPSQKGLKKLPTKVRNKMGYMKKGGRVGMGKAMRGGGCVR